MQIIPPMRNFPDDFPNGRAFKDYRGFESLPLRQRILRGKSLKFEADCTQNRTQSKDDSDAFQGFNNLAFIVRAIIVPACYPE